MFKKTNKIPKTQHLTKIKVKTEDRKLKSNSKY